MYHENVRVRDKSGYHSEYDMNPRYKPDYADGSAELSMMQERGLGLINLNDYINSDENKFPYYESINSTTYPEQNTDYLGANFYLRYIDETIHEIEFGWFKAIRWDAQLPFRVILINEKYKYMIVTEPDRVLPDNSSIRDQWGVMVANKHVHQIPIQNKTLLGLPVRDCYFKDKGSVAGTIIKADQGGAHPHFIILEKLNGDYRLISMEETMPIISLYDIVTQSGVEYWPSDWKNLYVENDYSYS